MSHIDHRRIAGNSLMLYLRMGLIALVGLYTTHVVLAALGKVDYGIYCAVGGVVMMASFISNTMSTACQRFFSFELGREDYERLRVVFTQCLIVFVLILLVVLALSETAGIWYLTHKMKLAGRDSAAYAVFQYSVAGFAFQIMRTPYMGMIIAREKMKVFAYISVLEALAILGVAMCLKHSGSDRLVLYARLMFAVQMVTAFFYWLYCRTFYRECRLTMHVGGYGFGRLFRFTGWEMIGALASVCRTYGVNLLLNPFFGPVANSARGLAQKVYMTVIQLNDNVYLSVKPQVVKSYANNAVGEMLDLLLKSTRLTYCLVLVVVMPLLMETPFLLGIWLNEVPEMTVLFTRLMLVNVMVDALSCQLPSAIQATGRNKWYQIAIGLTLLTILPIAYVGMKFFHMDAAFVFYVSIFVSFAAMAVRLCFVRHQLGLDVRRYFSSVILKVLSVTLVSAVLSVLTRMMAGNEGGAAASVCVISLSILWTAASMYFIGMTTSERINSVKVLRNLVGVGNKNNKGQKR